MIKAQVIADSKNEFGNRITTLVSVMPRYILAEFNTHRMLSRNSASSRAIPFEKNLQSVEENPFIPIAWMKDHKGMQGNEYFGEPATSSLLREWQRAKQHAVVLAKELSRQGLTKQLVNRLLEPFMWHTVIATATEWENFFALRCPAYACNDNGKEIFVSRSKKDFLKKLGNGSDKENTTNYLFGKPVLELNDIDWLKANKGQADIHMMAVSEAIWDAMNESTPKILQPGEWHIPYGDDFAQDALAMVMSEMGIKLTPKNIERVKIWIATARCARVSYTVFGEEQIQNTHRYVKDIELHNRLAASGHWSPFEHCAEAMPNSYFDGTPACWSGNFRGFVQYRKMFDNENIVKK